MKSPSWESPSSPMIWSSEMGSRAQVHRHRGAVERSQRANSTAMPVGDRSSSHPRDRNSIGIVT